MRVALVEDQRMFRELLEALLQAEGHEVVGRFAKGREAMEKLLPLRTELVVLDVGLPDVSGIEVLRHARRALPNARTLILTAYDKPRVVQEAFEAGAHGIVMKDTPVGGLREAIQHLAEDGVYYCPRTSALLREHASKPVAREPLTARERQIIALVASGLRTRDIARRLGIRDKTVSNHRLQIMNKLGIHDVAGLTRYAIRNELVEPEA